MNLDEANKVEHKVEDEWHYPILTKYGFIPKTKVATGLVRHYEYQNTDGVIIVFTTGYHGDYWRDLNTGDEKYWGELEEHLEKNYRIEV